MTRWHDQCFIPANMKRILFALLAIPGCLGGERAETGQCPAGEVCSPETPDGLQFVGSPLNKALVIGGPAATAIGGTQEIDIDLEQTLGVYTPFELPFTVDDQGGAGVKYVSKNGNAVIVEGEGSFSNYLRILDPSTNELFDRKELTGAAIDGVDLVVTDGEEVPTGPLVFASGDVTVGIALYGQVQEAVGPVDERIIDTSMVADVDGATQLAWDTFEIPDAGVGDFPVVVQAGSDTQTELTLTTVGGADTVTMIDPAQQIAPDSIVCFEATNSGRYVAGLPWTFTIDGTEVTGEENCVVPSQTTGTITILAEAGGQSTSVSLQILQSAIVRHKHDPRIRPTAGDRAALAAAM